MKRINRAVNFPDKYTIGKTECKFDCVSGTGEPIYKMKTREGIVRHFILILDK